MIKAMPSGGGIRRKGGVQFLHPPGASPQERNPERAFAVERNMPRLSFKGPVAMRIRLISLIFLLLCSLSGWAKVADVPLEQLQPERSHRQAALIITKVIGKYHYKDAPLDDRFSEEIFKRYLEALDPNRSYFTQPEIDGFAKYRRQFDDALRQADLEPAFEIFRAYRRRVEGQMNLAQELLRENHDFTRDEDYLFDRAEAPWPADEAALRELWRQRVKNDILGLRLADKTPEQVTDTLTKRYQGTIRRTRQLDADDVFQTFINAYTLSLEPHTSYMPPRQAENFDIGMRLSLEGIGAVLQLANEYTTVQKVIPGGPAAQSGEVHGGDRIVGVAQGKDGEMVDVVGWRLDDVVALIRGPKGSTVRLRILPKDAGADGPSRLSTLVRNEVKLEDQAAKSFVVDEVDGVRPWRIGVIDIPTFYHDFQGQSRGDKEFRSTTRDVRQLLLDLQKDGVDGIVIDLRGNGGGALSEATELTGLFIKTGPVVQVKKADGTLDVEKDSDPEVVYHGPLAVLVDRDSASASEIFAGAIQDYGRGIIIGEPTFGKGTVQTLIDLNRFIFKQQEDLGRLRLTMAQFFRVEGGSTQFKGVVPDIVFPTAVGADKDGERSLENALPWARIDAVAYPVAGIGDLESVRSAHLRRVAGDAGFKYLLEEERLRQQIRERKAVSLNEAKRREEWKQREEQRKQESDRFRTAMGLPMSEQKAAVADEEEGPRLDEEDEESKLIKRIAVNEAARILSHYVANRQPRAAMAH
jgi:carboxyl-terminal processing protease